MAVANLDTKKVTAKYHVMTVMEGTALDGTAGGTFTVNNPSEKTLLIIENTDASNTEKVTIKAPVKPALRSRYRISR